MTNHLLLAIFHIVALTCIVTMDSNNYVNAVMTTRRPVLDYVSGGLAKGFSDKMTYYLNQIVVEKMRSHFIGNHQKMMKKSIIILDEHYSMKPASFLATDDNVRTVEKIYSVNGELCAKIYSSNQANLVNECLTALTGSLKTDNVNYDENSFFNTMDIYSNDAGFLVLGSYHIRTPKKCFKYRVTNHLGRKIFFIGLEHDSSTSGDLYAADLKISEDEDIIVNVVDVGMVKLKDITIEQYTGNILLVTEHNMFFVLEKLPYAKALNVLYKNLYEKFP